MGKHISKHKARQRKLSLAGRGISKVSLDAIENHLRLNGHTHRAKRCQVTLPAIVMRTPNWDVRRGKIINVVE